MERRHRSLLNTTTKSITHDKIAAISKLGYEVIELREIVRIVGVAHNHEAPTCCGDPATERRTVTAIGNRHHARAEPLRDVLRSVGRAIIGDQYLAANFQTLIDSSTPFSRKRR